MLIVARNTAPFIGAALRSARAQTFEDIEILVVDDGSTDGTRQIAMAEAALDPRIRVIDGPRRGLAAVRNTSLAAARGRWAAILDSDDLIHPDHVARLVAEARATGAEIIAANMIAFAIEQGRCRTALFAAREPWRRPRRIGLAEYVRCNSAFGDPACVGYLKPLLDLDFLRHHNLEYDPRLRISEDYDLVARMIARGGRFSYLPRPTYFYRRHRNSTSYRQSEADLTAMLAAAESVIAAGSPRDVRMAVARRKAGIRTVLRHTRAIEALKRQGIGAAHAALGTDLRAWSLLAKSAFEGTGRRLGSLRHSRPTPPPVALVIGTPQQGSALEAQIAEIAASGLSIVTRPLPIDDHARATLIDGLPPLMATFVAPPGTADDAGYAIVHAGIDLIAQQAPCPTSMQAQPPLLTPETV
ncbi:glycosyl transferase family 2 [Novosphingobium sp. PhB165]|nr:glycosyl transferase family 2 [Novosphingobium sp. PhB165]